jgi:predicted AlkP superfamily phosphohydrolase/phosphomutase
MGMMWEGIPMGRRKTLVIGIDGACWEYLDPLIENGDMPNLKVLVEGGSRGVLESTVPFISPVAWSSFITGMRPEKHGIVDWWIRDNRGKGYRPMCVEDRRAPGFWKYLNEAGVRVGVSRLPVTYPAERIDGFLVCGFDAPSGSERRVYPSELYRRIMGEYGEGFFKIPGYDRLSDENECVKFVSEYARYEDLQTEVLIKVIEEYGVDVVAVNYMICDHISHRAVNYDAMKTAARCVDANIGRLLEAYPGSNVIIISDHGSFRSHGAFLIYGWLEKNGFVKFRHRGRERVKLNIIIGSLLRDRMGWEGIIEKVARHGLVGPIGLSSWLSEFVIRHLNNRVKSRYFFPHNAIDRRKSKVIYCSPGSFGMFINVKAGGGKRGGVGEGVEYEKVRSELIEKLSEVVDPFVDERLFDRVNRREDVFSGHYSDRGADVIPHLGTKCNICTWERVDDGGGRYEFFRKNDWAEYYGQHTEEGLFVLYGEDFDKGSAIDRLKLIDIPALVLYLNGVGIPKDFDGRVELGVMDKEYASRYAVRYQEVEKKSWSERDGRGVKEEDVKEVESRLKDLGYM